MLQNCHFPSFLTKTTGELHALVTGSNNLLRSNYVSCFMASRFFSDPSQCGGCRRFWKVQVRFPTDSSFYLILHQCKTYYCGGSMVKFSPAVREAQVRFWAYFFLLLSMQDFCTTVVQLCNYSIQLSLLRQPKRVVIQQASSTSAPTRFGLTPLLPPMLKNLIDVSFCVLLYRLAVMPKSLRGFHCIVGFVPAVV